MKKVKQKWDELDKGIQKWATRLGAIASIVGVVAAGGGWIIHQIDNSIAAKLEAQTSQLQHEVQSLSDQVDEKNKQTELQLTRLELISLIQYHPENKLEIEKLARRYFTDLGGDTWMSSEYVIWANKYNGNIEFVIK